MARNDALRIGKPDACALKLIGGMQTLKHAKQLTSMAHVETDAIIAIENRHFVRAAGAAADLYDCGIARTAIFDCIDSRFTNTWRSSAGSPRVFGQAFRRHSMFLSLGVGPYHFERCLEHCFELDFDRMQLRRALRENVSRLRNQLIPCAWPR